MALLACPISASTFGGMGTKASSMTACSSQRPAALNLNAVLQPGPTPVLFGAGVSFLLALGFFTLVWLHLDSLFKAYPALAIPFVGTMMIGPTFLFVSIRRITEIGMRKRLVFSAFLSATAIGLIALSFLLSLRHFSGH
jgi:hypothetical protein